MRLTVNLRRAFRPAVARATVLALAAFALSAGTADAEPLGDGGKVRLLFNEAGTNSFIPFTIKKFGLDKKHGFELVPVPTTTTAAGITAMKAGAAEVHTFGWNDIARMNNAGIPVVGVAPFLRWGADFILVPKDSPIKTIGDLKGKKVGTSSRTRAELGRHDGARRQEVSAHRKRHDGPRRRAAAACARCSSKARSTRRICSIP